MYTQSCKSLRTAIVPQAQRGGMGGATTKKTCSMQGFFVIPKCQAPNPNLLLIIDLDFVYFFVMETSSNTKYDLDQRTFNFSKNVSEYFEKLPNRLTNTEIGRQLIRSAGSVGANYIEAV